jgi:hypothetical protein
VLGTAQRPFPTRFFIQPNRSKGCLRVVAVASSSGNLTASNHIAGRIGGSATSSGDYVPFSDISMILIS